MSTVSIFPDLHPQACGHIAMGTFVSWSQLHRGRLAHPRNPRNESHSMHTCEDIDYVSLRKSTSIFESTRRCAANAAIRMPTSQKPGSCCLQATSRQRIQGRRRAPLISITAPSRSDGGAVLVALSLDTIHRRFSAGRFGTKVPAFIRKGEITADAGKILAMDRSPRLHPPLTPVYVGGESRNWPAPPGPGGGQRHR
ncbi:hypothetical protein VTO73DRAFT_11426 [Trametes versicolor]